MPVQKMSGNLLNVPHILSSVANANSLLLINPLEVLSFSCGYALHLVVRNVFIFNLFSACLWLSTSTSKLPFLVFLRVFKLALVDITFSMRKDENLARHTSSIKISFNFIIQSKTFNRKILTC